MTLKKVYLIEVGRPAEKTAFLTNTIIYLYMIAGVGRLLTGGKTATILTGIIKEIYYAKTNENMRPRFNYK
jgi:hypothetical protein